VEGPEFRGDRVRWDCFDDGVCRVPADAVGAPAAPRGLTSGR
jgi:dihydroorotate dehydrogenase electron transfer subunit